MRIYVAHSKQMNYMEDLYKPLRNDKFFDDYELILPHEASSTSKNGRAFYKTIDVFIADCSEVATGLGIEIGWVYDEGKPINVIHKKGTKLNGSVLSVATNVYEYENNDRMVEIVKNIVLNQN